MQRHAPARYVRARRRRDLTMPTWQAAASALLVTAGATIVFVLVFSLMASATLDARALMPIRADEAEECGATFVSSVEVAHPAEEHPIRPAGGGALFSTAYCVTHNAEGGYVTCFTEKEGLSTTVTMPLSQTRVLESTTGEGWFSERVSRIERSARVTERELWLTREVERPVDERPDYITEYTLCLPKADLDTLGLTAEATDVETLPTIEPE